MPKLRGLIGEIWERRVVRHLFHILKNIRFACSRKNCFTFGQWHLLLNMSTSRAAKKENWTPCRPKHGGMTINWEDGGGCYCRKLGGMTGNKFKLLPKKLNNRYKGKTNNGDPSKVTI